MGRDRKKKAHTIGRDGGSVRDRGKWETVRGTVRQKQLELERSNQRCREKG